MASDALIWLAKQVLPCRLVHRLILAVINVASPLGAVQNRLRLTVVSLPGFRGGLMAAVAEATTDSCAICRFTG